MKIKHKRRRVLFGLSIVILILLLFSLEVILWSMALIFDDEPLQAVNKPPDYDVLEQISTKFGISTYH